MKNNSIASIIVLLGTIFITQSVCADSKWEIINLEPHNQSIKIGNRYLRVDSTFSEKDTIIWDKNNPNQAMRVICVDDCAGVTGPHILQHPHNCSLLQNQREHGGERVSFAEQVGLYSKGVVKEPIILWRGELIPIEGISPLENCVYYCKIQGNTRTFSLILRDGILYLKSDDFRDFGTEITLEVIQENTEDGTVETLLFLDVEQVK